MNIALIVGRSAEIDLPQPAQQTDGGEYTSVRIAPGTQKIVITGEKPGQETLRFQLEDGSEIELNVAVG